MKKSLVLLLSLVLVLSLALTGCTPAEDTAAADSTSTEAPEATETSSESSVKNPAKTRSNADTLIVGMTEAKGEVLPAYYSTAHDGYLVDLMFDSLLSNDASGELINKLATGYELSNDNKTYTFTIRDDVRFSDGTPLTAHDVAFTFRALCDPTYDGRYNSVVYELEGYEAYNTGDADDVAGIEVIDDHTVAFTFQTAKANNINNFVFGIMPEHIYGFEKGDSLSMRKKMQEFNIVGSGRYELVKFEPSQYVEFVANDDWYGGEINNEKLIAKFTTADTYMQELQAGTIDMQIQVPAKKDNEAQINDMGFVNINAYPANSYGYIGMNLRDPRLAEKDVRQALMYGFNREAFIGIYFNGYAQLTNTPISRVSWAYNDNVHDYAYDADKAIELLEGAGWMLNANGVREKDGMELSFVWDTYTDSKYVETMIPMLKADWEKIGVKVEPNLMEFNSLVEKVYTEQDFDLYNMAWVMTTDPGDSYYTFHSDFDIPDGNNSVGLHNDKIDQLLEDGSREFDREKRAEIYQEFALEINEELPYLFLSQGDQWDVANERVKNVNITSYENWTYHIEDIELEK